MSEYFKIEGGAYRHRMRKKGLSYSDQEEINTVQGWRRKASASRNFQKTGKRTANPRVGVGFGVKKSITARDIINGARRLFKK